MTGEPFNARETPYVVPQPFVCVTTKFALEQAMKAQTGVDVELYSFFNLDARWRRLVNVTSRRLYPQ